MLPLQSVVKLGCSLPTRDPVFCDEFIDIYAYPIWSNFWYHYINPDYICNQIYFCSDRTFTAIDSKKEARTYLEGRPTTRNRNYPPSPFPPGRPVWKMMQLSDAHVDRSYMKGANSHCNLPICCRKQNGMGSSKDNSAGFWGHVGQCDIPMHTAHSALNYTIKEHNPDFIIWTGDMLDHQVWLHTYEN